MEMLLNETPKDLNEILVSVHYQAIVCIEVTYSLYTVHIHVVSPFLHLAVLMPEGTAIVCMKVTYSLYTVHIHVVSPFLHLAVLMPEGTTTIRI